MKSAITLLIALFSFNLGAKEMEDPIDLVTNLFISTDQGNWDELKEIFDSQVNLDYSSMTGNPAAILTADEIIASWRSILPGFESTHHQMGNMLSKIEGEEARVFCYGTASHYLNDELGNLWVVVGSYDFDLSKDENNKWKVKSMKFNFKYQDGNLSLPTKAINILKDNDQK